MRTTGPIVKLIFAVSVGCSSLGAETESSPSEIEQPKSPVSAQQKGLEQQQAQIQKLQSALAEQRQMLIGVVQNGSGSAR